MSPRGPAFDAEVPRGGYLWWYIDAISAAGDEALTIIVFVGSVFSPYYFRARTRERRAEGGVGVEGADPREHFGMNVALYRRRAKHWALTEYRRHHVEASADALRMGGNRISRRADGGLLLRIDEHTAPWARPLRGEVRLLPGNSETSCAPIELMPGAGHYWQPVAPVARVEASFERPAWEFSGSGYYDSNWGPEPLEATFRRWDWSRMQHGGHTMVIYDLEARNTARGTAGGSSTEMARRHAWVLGPQGSAQPLVGASQEVILGPSRWGLDRRTRIVLPSASAAARGSEVKLVRSLEDGPFYARSLLARPEDGGVAYGMHESLDLDRFRTVKTQLMLRFRMRRRR